MCGLNRLVRSAVHMALFKVEYVRSSVCHDLKKAALERRLTLLDGV